MTGLQRRVKRIISHLGESFTVGASSGQAVFSVLGSSLGNALMGSATVDAATRPLRIAYTAFDDATAESSTLRWNGRDYLVQRVTEVRLRGVTIAKILALTMVTTASTGGSGTGLA